MRYLLPLVAAAASFGQSVSIVSGNGQVTPQHTRFEPLVVQVRNAAGVPAAGVTVNWTVIEGNGQGLLGNFETSASSVTDANGLASMDFFQNPFSIFGTSFAQSRVTAAALGATATFAETTIFTEFQSGLQQVNVYPQFAIERISGAAGTVHPSPFIVQVIGLTGGPVSGVAITVLAGDQVNEPSVACVTSPGQQPGTVLTDASGTAACHLRFSGIPGDAAFTLLVGGNWRLLPAAPLPFTVTRGQTFSMEALSGGNQTGTVGTTLPLPLFAQVRDSSNNGVPGQAVTWEVVQGGGTFSAANSSSDQFGRVWTSFTPTVAGVSQVRARLADNAGTQALFTLLANPVSSGCTFSVTPSTLSAPVSGQAASANLSASNPSCAWTAQSNAGWLQLTSAAAGNGSAVITFTVAPNTGAGRSGTIAAGGQTITVTQAGSAQTGCSVSLTMDEVSAPSVGGGGEIALDSSGSCSWTASSDRPWLVVAPASGAGPGSVSYTVYPNFGTRTRTGHLTIAGQTIAVNQFGTFGTEPGRFLSHVFYNFFGRLPSPSELVGYLRTVDATVTRAQLVESFLASSEFSAAGRFAAGLYLGLLNRDPEFGGWFFHRNALAAGAGTSAQAVASFLSSPEFTLQHASLSDQQFIALLYTQILRRAPSQSETDAMLSAMRGGLSRADMAVNMLSGQEFRSAANPRLTAFALYATILMRDPTASERQALITRLETGGSVQSAIQDLLNGAEFHELLR
jgi:hypothetical protein